LARERKVDLTLEAGDDLPALYANRRSIIQIVLNLLSNAVKFSNQGESVLISVAAVNGRLIINVIDTGIGIPSGDLANITDPFSQAHNDPHLSQEGTGLGLSIVKSLVEAHKGKLDIVSEVGMGTTVTVELPLVTP
jgi:two-component system cell cycle sensor histidine kinase PleC